MNYISDVLHPGRKRIEMAANSNGRSVVDISGSQNGAYDRLKTLYPMVNEEETPLPRSWSPKDKYNYIGLSQNNLRVHYKGEYCFGNYHNFLFLNGTYG